MKLSEEYKYLEEQLKKAIEIIEIMQQRLQLADKSWPDHQVLPFCDWRDRSEVPPVGKVWASDGIGVWLINSDGKPVPETATAVKFWSTAYIPAPPEMSGPATDNK